MSFFDKFSKKDKEQENPTTKSIIESVECPHQIFGNDSTAAEINQAYQNALTRGKAEGFTPVLVTSDETLEEWFGFLPEDDSYSRTYILQEQTDNGRDILETRYQEYINDYIEDHDLEINSDENIDYEKREPDEFLGELTEGDTLTDLPILNQPLGNNPPAVILFEIPTANPWEVIAWIPFGGWNECPPPDEMIAVCRHWYEKYKAFPAAISHDEMEFYLEDPIQDEDTAWKLAKEHYAFCPDRIDQCTQTGTAGELADTILGSNVWYFWWD